MIADDFQVATLLLNIEHVARARMKRLANSFWHQQTIKKYFISLVMSVNASIRFSLLFLRHPYYDPRKYQHHTQPTDPHH